MSTHSKHIVHNTRERITSTDFTDMQALVDAGITDTAVALGGKGLNVALGGKGLSGVLDGFVVRAEQPGVNSVIKIGPGVAYKVVTPDNPATDSRYQRLETWADLSQDLQPFRAASPRWVCISIRPNIQTVTALVDGVPQRIKVSVKAITLELAYADLEINGHRETWPIRGAGFKDWLVHKYYLETGGAPNSEAFQTARGAIQAKARYDAPQMEVHMRVAGQVLHRHRFGGLL